MSARLRVSWTRKPALIAVAEGSGGAKGSRRAEGGGGLARHY
jgi:hypothetical protein